MRKHAFVAAGALLTIILATSALTMGCGEKVPSGAIVKVGDGVVTVASFDKIIDQAKAQAKQPGQTAFPKAGTAAYKQYAARVVEYLVQQEIINQAAVEFRVEASAKDVKARVDQLIKAYGGKKKVTAILKKQGMTWKDLDQVMKDQIVGQKVYNRVIKTAKVSKAQIKAYYEKNKDQFDTAETRKIRHILVKTKAEADKVRALLVADPSAANWKKVAKQYSIDPGSKDSSGSLGDVTPGMMVPAFDKSAFSLKVGQLSAPIKTQFGWHVIEVTKITPAKKSTLADVQAQIKETISADRQQKVWDKWLKQRERDAEIVYAAGYDPKKLAKASPSAKPTKSSSPTQTASPEASPSPSASQ